MDLWKSGAVQNGDRTYDEVVAMLLNGKQISFVWSSSEGGPNEEIILTYGGMTHPSHGPWKPNKLLWIGMRRRATIGLLAHDQIHEDTVAEHWPQMSQPARVAFRMLIKSIQFRLAVIKDNMPPEPEGSIFTLTLPEN